MTNKEDEYKVIEWQQSSLLENATTIIRNAQFSIHRIELSDEKSVYLVPEAFYKAAIAALKRSRANEN